MKEDRHLKVIERSTMDNIGNQSLMIYQFKDGFEIKVKKMAHDMLLNLSKEHGYCVTVKRMEGI